MNYLIIQYSNGYWEIFRQQDSKHPQRCKGYYDTLQELATKTLTTEDTSFFSADLNGKYTTFERIKDDISQPYFMEILTHKQLTLLAL
jgi:hypothetical protein